MQKGLDDEWTSTWHSDALKAGAVAYRSYGAFFVAHALTSTYDICSTASCQRFTSTSARPTSTAASATAGVVLSQNGSEIFKAEYAPETNGLYCSDGWTGRPDANWPCMKDTLNAGAAGQGHGRGMSKWGSQRWATGTNPAGAVVTMPKDWECILDHYYNDNADNTGSGTGNRTAYMAGSTAGRGRIVFSKPDAHGIGSQIYTMYADGSGLSQLTNTRDKRNMYPSWSPGGDKIAFWYETGGNGIYLMNADGSALTPLTSGVYGNYFPHWSRDRKIAYTWNSTQNYMPVNIMTINEDGSNLAQLTNDPYLNDEPNWSPDGTRIVFSSKRGDTVSPQVYVMNADGSNVTQLTSPPLYANSPSWSPDGTKIAFAASIQQSCCNNIFVMNSDGSGQTQITFSPSPFRNDGPQWSQDGKRIVFTSTRDSAGGWRWDIYVMDANGSNVMRLTTNDMYGQPPYPDWMRCSRCDCPECPSLPPPPSLQVSGNNFIFVGSDPHLASVNKYFATIAQPPGGTFSASSSDPNDVIATGSTGGIPWISVTTLDQSAQNLDRVLTFSYTLSDGRKVSPSREVTSRQFAYATNPPLTSVCGLGYGYQYFIAYTLYTHPDQTAVEPGLGLDGTPVAENFEPPAIACPIETGSGNLDANSLFTDRIAMCSTTPIPACSSTHIQTLSIAGYLVRSNSLTISDTGLVYTNQGPIQ